MKKIVLLLLGVALFASIEGDIYTIIVRALFPRRYEVKIWVDDKNKLAVFHEIPHSHLVPSPKSADIVFLFHKEANLTIPAHTLVFVGSYPLLLRYKKRAIGGFFWQKGRPNIIFLRTNLQEHNITLPANLHQYIEDRL